MRNLLAHSCLHIVSKLALTYWRRGLEKTTWCWLNLHTTKKSNQSTAFQLLLQQLALDGCISTLDSMFAQTRITQQGTSVFRALKEYYILANMRATVSMED